MKQINLSNVKEAGSNRQIPAGGYVAKITQVTDNPKKGYLLIEFDIAEGEYKEYFKELEERAGFWGCSEYRSYSKETALPMLKRFCSAVTKSNPGYIFDADTQNADEKTLVDKYIGIVLYEEEYEKNNGDIGTRLKVSYECDVENIRQGNFNVPAKKCIERTITNDFNSNDFVTISDEEAEEVPFS